MRAGREIAVIAPFAVSGLIHLLRPQAFTPIIPTPLRPWARELVVVSGWAELCCAVGLTHPRTRPAAGRAAAALLVAVWPANAQMSIDLARRAARRRPARPADVAALVISLARLPLQVPLIRIAWRAGRPR